jgi:hypothetical protein
MDHLLSSDSPILNPPFAASQEKILDNSEYKSTGDWVMDTVIEN